MVKDFITCLWLLQPFRFHFLYKLILLPQVNLYCFSRFFSSGREVLLLSGYKSRQPNHVLQVFIHELLYDVRWEKSFFVTNFARSSDFIKEDITSCARTRFRSFLEHGTQATRYTDYYISLYLSYRFHSKKDSLEERKKWFLRKIFIAQNTTKWKRKFCFALLRNIGLFSIFSIIKSPYHCMDIAKLSAKLSISFY